MSDMYGQGNSLHEGNVKPLRGFTPRQRLDAPDPLLRVIGHSTEAISLAGANTNPTINIAGEKYDLGGFVAGIFRVTWNEGANHAVFQAYRDGAGDAALDGLGGPVPDRAGHLRPPPLPGDPSHRRPAPGDEGGEQGDPLEASARRIPAQLRETARAGRRRPRGHGAHRIFRPL
jgi:hypothetical protein